jgi:ATP-binding protein involved in chromosome partitioning
MAPQNEPVDLVVKRDEGVTVTYADGHVATFALVELRHACPCATCRSLRDLNDELWPRPSSPVPLTIANAEMHGAWGLNITWNDGHATGIYPFDALRRWSDNGRPVGREYGEPVNPLNQSVTPPPDHTDHQGSDR